MQHKKDVSVPHIGGGDGGGGRERGLQAHTRCSCTHNNKLVQGRQPETIRGVIRSASATHTNPPAVEERQEERGKETGIGWARESRELGKNTVEGAAASILKRSSLAAIEDGEGTAVR